jgi:predicted phosphodiesterase
MAIRILHLSDIHFKDYTGKELFDNNRDIRDELETDLARQVELIGQIDLILIGGDIAFSGKDDQYAVADAWISRLCDITNCRVENVLMVPGNHDVDRSKISLGLREIQREFKSKGSLEEVNVTLEKYMSDIAFRPVLQTPLKNFDNFALKYGATPPEHKLFWEYFIEYKNHKICIRGINSALVSNDEDHETTSKLAVGSMQCIISRRAQCINIVLCHHPPSWLIAGEEIENNLCARAALLLFGHVHAFSSRQINNTLILAAGAVQPGRFEPNWEPRYNIIELNLEEEVTPPVLNIMLWKRAWNRSTLMFEGDHLDPSSDHDIHNLNVADYGQEVTQIGNVNGENVMNEVMPDKENKLKINEPNNVKILAYRFMSLPYHVRLQIATNLKLQEDSDEDISDLEKTKAYFKRARERNIFKNLWLQINEQKGEKLQNPFDL